MNRVSLLERKGMRLNAAGSRKKILAFGRSKKRVHEGRIRSTFAHRPCPEKNTWLIILEAWKGAFSGARNKGGSEGILDLPGFLEGSIQLLCLNSEVHFKRLQRLHGSFFGVSSSPGFSPELSTAPPGGGTFFWTLNASGVCWGFFTFPPGGSAFSMTLKAGGRGPSDDTGPPGGVALSTLLKASGRLDSSAA